MPLIAQVEGLGDVTIPDDASELEALSSVLLEHVKAGNMNNYDAQLAYAKAKREQYAPLQNVPAAATDEAPSEETEGDGGFLSGFWGGYTGMLGSTLSGSEELAESLGIIDKTKEPGYVRHVGELLEDYGQQFSISPDADSLDQGIHKFGQVMGSLGAFVTVPAVIAAGFKVGGAGLALTKAATWITATLMGVGAGADQGYDRAKRYGATDDEIDRMTRWSGLIGSTEALPVGYILKPFVMAKKLFGKKLHPEADDGVPVFGSESARAAKIAGKEKEGLIDALNNETTRMGREARLNNVIGKMLKKDISGLREYSRGIAKQFGFEGGQEFTAAVLQDLAARSIYNPDVDILNMDSIEEGLYGGSAGAVFQGLMTAFGPRKAKFFRRRMDAFQQTDEYKTIRNEAADAAEAYEQATTEEEKNAALNRFNKANNTMTDAMRDVVYNTRDMEDYLLKQKDKDGELLYSQEYLDRVKEEKGGLERIYKSHVMDPRTVYERDAEDELMETNHHATFLNEDGEVVVKEEPYTVDEIEDLKTGFQGEALEAEVRARREDVQGTRKESPLPSLKANARRRHGLDQARLTEIERTYGERVLINYLNNLKTLRKEELDTILEGLEPKAQTDINVNAFQQAVISRIDFAAKRKGVETEAAKLTDEALKSLEKGKRLGIFSADDLQRIQNNRAEGKTHLDGFSEGEIDSLGDALVEMLTAEEVAKVGRKEKDQPAVNPEQRTADIIQGYGEMQKEAALKDEYYNETHEEADEDIANYEKWKKEQGHAATVTPPEEKVTAVEEEVVVEEEPFEPFATVSLTDIEKIEAAIPEKLRALGRKVREKQRAYFADHNKGISEGFPSKGILGAYTRAQNELTNAIDEFRKNSPEVPQNIKSNIFYVHALPEYLTKYEVDTQTLEDIVRKYEVVHEPKVEQETEILTDADLDIVASNETSSEQNIAVVQVRLNQLVMNTPGVAEGVASGRPVRPVPQAMIRTRAVVEEIAGRENTDVVAESLDELYNGDPAQTSYAVAQKLAARFPDKVDAYANRVLTQRTESDYAEQAKLLQEEWKELGQAPPTGRAVAVIPPEVDQQIEQQLDEEFGPITPEGQQVVNQAKRNPDGSYNYRGYVITKIDEEMTGRKGSVYWNFGPAGQPIEDTANTLKGARAAIDDILPEDYMETLKNIPRGDRGTQRIGTTMPRAEAGDEQPFVQSDPAQSVLNVDRTAEVSDAPPAKLGFVQELYRASQSDEDIVVIRKLLNAPETKQYTATPESARIGVYRIEFTDGTRLNVDLGFAEKWEELGKYDEYGDTSDNEVVVELEGSGNKVVIKEGTITFVDQAGTRVQPITFKNWEKLSKNDEVLDDGTTSPSEEKISLFQQEDWYQIDEVNEAVTAAKEQKGKREFTGNTQKEEFLFNALFGRLKPTPLKPLDQAALEQAPPAQRKKKQAEIRNKFENEQRKRLENIGEYVEKVNYFVAGTDKNPSRYKIRNKQLREEALETDVAIDPETKRKVSLTKGGENIPESELLGPQKGQNIRVPHKGGYMWVGVNDFDVNVKNEWVNTIKEFPRSWMHKAIFNRANLTRPQQAIAVRLIGQAQKNSIDFETTKFKVHREKVLKRLADGLTNRNSFTINEQTGEKSTPVMGEGDFRNLTNAIMNIIGLESGGQTSPALDVDAQSGTHTFSFDHGPTIIFERGSTEEALGSYDPETNTIRINVDIHERNASPFLKNNRKFNIWKSLLNTSAHEAFHAAKRLVLAKDPELALFFDQHVGIDLATRNGWKPSKYAEENNEIKLEEAQAFIYGRWYEGHLVEGLHFRQRTLLGKIKEFIDKVVSFAKGNGFVVTDAQVKSRSESEFTARLVREQFRNLADGTLAGQVGRMPVMEAANYAAEQNPDNTKTLMKRAMDSLLSPLSGGVNESAYSIPGIPMSGIPAAEGMLKDLSSFGYFMAHMSAVAEKSPYFKEFYSLIQKRTQIRNKKKISADTVLYHAGVIDLSEEQRKEVQTYVMIADGVGVDIGYNGDTGRGSILIDPAKMEELIETHVSLERFARDLGIDASVFGNKDAEGNVVIEITDPVILKATKASHEVVKQLGEDKYVSVMYNFLNTGDAAGFDILRLGSDFDNWHYTDGGTGGVKDRIGQLIKDLGEENITSGSSGFLKFNVTNYHAYQNRVKQEAREQGKNEAAALRNSLFNGMDGEKAKGIFSILDSAYQQERKGYFPHTRFGDTAVVVHRIGEKGELELVRMETVQNSWSDSLGGIPVLGQAFESRIAEKANDLAARLSSEWGSGYVVSKPFKLTLDSLRSASNPDRNTILQAMGTIEALAQIYVGNRNGGPDGSDWSFWKTGERPEEGTARTKTSIEGFIDMIKSNLAETRAQALTRERKDIPGFINVQNNSGKYFSLTLQKYIDDTSNVISSLAMEPAILESISQIRLAHGPESRMARLAEGQFNYVNNPNNEATKVRMFAFHMFLGGHFSSAFVNLTQTFQATLPILSSIVGAGSGSATVFKAFMDSSRLWKHMQFSLGTRAGKYGFDFFTVDPLTGKSVKNNAAKPDWMSQEEFDFLADLFERGVIQPIQNLDLGAGAEGITSAPLRNLAGASGYMFGMAENINRVTAALAFYRAAKKGNKTLQFTTYAKSTRFEDVFGDINNLPMEETTVDADGKEITTHPFAKAMAEIGVEKTQFFMGKENRPFMFRGRIMSVVSQFQSFLFQMLGLYADGIMKGVGQRVSAGMSVEEAAVLKRMAQKQVGMMTMMMWAFSGAMGLPFADNLKQLLKWLSENFGDEVSYNVEIGFRDSIGPVLGYTATDMMLRGLFRPFMDIARRTGYSEPIPLRAFMGGDVTGYIGPGPAAAVQMVKDANLAMERGDTIGAIAAILPLSVRNVTDALHTIPEYGLQTYRGKTMLPPGVMDTGELALKSLGFRTGLEAKMAVVMERTRHEDLKLTRYQELMTQKLVNSYSAAMAAGEEDDWGDMERYMSDYNGTFMDIYQYNMDQEDPSLRLNTTNLARTVRKRWLEARYGMATSQFNRKLSEEQRSAMNLAREKQAISPELAERMMAA